MSNLDQYNSVLFLDKIIEEIIDKKEEIKKSLNPEFNNSYKHKLGVIEGLDYVTMLLNNAKKRYGLDE